MKTIGCPVTNLLTTKMSTKTHIDSEDNWLPGDELGLLGVDGYLYGSFLVYLEPVVPLGLLAPQLGPLHGFTLLLCSWDYLKLNKIKHDLLVNSKKSNVCKKNRIIFKLLSLILFVFYLVH